MDVNAAVVKAPEEFSGAMAAYFGDMLTAALGGSDRVVADLTSTRHCGLSAVGELWRVHMLARQRGKEMRIARSASVADELVAAGLHEEVRCYPGLDRAIGATTRT